MLLQAKLPHEIEVAVVPPLGVIEIVDGLVDVKSPMTLNVAIDDDRY